MLEFCEITKIFDTDIFKKKFLALDKLSFKIEEGKTIGFLGANGAGKTTSLKIAMDFIRPSSGKIIYGKALGEHKKNAFQYIGYLPERPFFYPHLTGREFSFYMGSLSNLSEKRIKEQIEYWSPRFKIEFALDRKIKNYSKGMLQRIGFLVTMLHDPKLIVLDEPLSGLDPIGRKELRDVIAEINGLGKTVFFSSHIVSDVEEVCEKVIFIKNGKLVYDGNVDTIINENLKMNSKVRYISKDEHKSIIVDHENLNVEIEKIIANNNQLISIEPNKPTLEEIFYSVK